MAYPVLNEGNNNVQLTTPVNQNYAAPAGDGPVAGNNVVYVNQFGQPIAPPVQPQTVYVNQYGQPVAPPQQTQVIQQTIVPQQRQVVQRKINPYYDNMDQNEKNMRSCAVILGIASLVAIIIGIIIDELADGDVYAQNALWIVYGEWNCGFTAVNAEFLGFEVASWPYGDLCNQGAEDGIPIDAACEAKTGGLLALICVILSGLFIVVGLIYVQPKTEVKRQISQCPRILFGIAAVLCALAPIIWVPQSEDLCRSDEYWNLETGSTIYALIAGCILIVITCVLAK
eukprot:267239_1